MPSSKKSCCHKGIQTITTASTDTTDQKPIKVCSKCKYTLLQFYGSDQLGSNTPEIILGRGFVGQEKYIAVANSFYGHYRLLFKYETTHTIVFGPNTASVHLLYTEQGWEILQGDRNTFTAGISNLSLTTNTWVNVTGDDPNNPLPKDSISGNTIYSYGYINISNPIILSLGSNSPVQAGDRLIYTVRSEGWSQLWYRINAAFVVQKVFLNDTISSLPKPTNPGDRVGKTVVSQNNTTKQLIVYQYDSTTDTVSQKVFLDNTNDNYDVFAVNWDGNTIAVLNHSKNIIDIYDTNNLTTPEKSINIPTEYTNLGEYGMLYNTNIVLSSNSSLSTVGSLVINPSTNDIYPIEPNQPINRFSINSNFVGYLYPTTSNSSSYKLYKIGGNTSTLPTMNNTDGSVITTMNSEVTDIYALMLYNIPSSSGFNLYHYSNQQTNSTGQYTLTEVQSIIASPEMNQYYINVSYDGEFLGLSNYFEDGNGNFTTSLQILKIN